MSKWIAVEERLPEKYKDLLLHTTTDGIDHGWWDGKEWVLYRTDPYDETIRFPTEMVTHWQPIEPPPSPDSAAPPEKEESSDEELDRCAREIVALEAACIEWGSPPERSVQVVKDSIRKFMGGGYAKA